MATTTSARPITHPRLVRRQTVEQPIGWSSSDTLFVLLLIAAVTVCALVPLALL